MSGKTSQARRVEAETPLVYRESQRQASLREEIERAKAALAARDAALITQRPVAGCAHAVGNGNGVDVHGAAADDAKLEARELK